MMMGLCRLHQNADTGRLNALFIRNTRELQSSISMGNDAEVRRPCPAWIEEYDKFHRAFRHHPSSKYLIYLCSRGRSDDNVESHQSCNGLGDRLKGMMFMTRLAHAANRILIINHTHPVELTEGFLPGGFDWQVGNLSAPCDNLEFPCMKTDEFGRNISAIFWSSSGGWGPLPEWITDASFVNSSTTHIYMTAIHPPDYVLPDWVTEFQTNPVQGSHYHCLFGSLFRASDQVDALVRDSEKQLWGNQSSSAYLSLHLRMSIDDRMMSDSEIHSSFSCALLLSAENNIQRLFVATDSSDLKSEIMLGRFPGFVTLDFKPVNVHAMQKSETGHHKMFLETVAEFVMLSRSTCLIMSRSGFSEAAQWMGGQQCWATVHRCAAIAGE